MEHEIAICTEDTRVEFEEGGEFIATKGDYCTLATNDRHGQTLYNDDREESSVILLDFNNRMDNDEDWFNKHFSIIG